MDETMREYGDGDGFPVTPAVEARQEFLRAQRLMGTAHAAVDLLVKPPSTLEGEFAHARLAQHTEGQLGDVVTALEKVRAALRLVVPALAISVAALLFSPAGVERAAAAATAPAGKTWTAQVEGPQPDRALPGPGAPVYRVVLSGATATVRVPLVLTGTAGPWRCGSVYGPDPFWGVARVGHACTTGRFVTVTATLAASVLRYGPHNTIWVADDFAPDGETAAVVDARRPSRFGRGHYEDRGSGDLYARVPVSLYSPALGRWVGQSRSPVQIQRLTRRGWRVVATLTTNPPGVATGIVHLGGGKWTIRAVRPAGQSMWGVTGVPHEVNVTTEPFNID